MKVGITGCGMIVNELLTFIHHVANFELTGIVSIPEEYEKVKELKNKFNIKRAYHCYNEMLEEDEIEVIYLGVPNHLHFKMAKQALNKGKHVIVEKPFVVSLEQGLELKQLAIDKHLMIFEAIPNQYFANYQIVKDVLPFIGDVKVIIINFSQYSSRYKAFKEGIILPAFDCNMAGGALMDLNVYNIHFVVGLFGEPKNIEYYPNIENNIDTSGILILEYEKFKCVCVGAKDCKSPTTTTIQGDQGYIYIDTPLSFMNSLEIRMNNGEKEYFNESSSIHRMYEEFEEMVRIYENQDFEKCYRILEYSLVVSNILAIARKKGGILFLDNS